MLTSLAALFGACVAMGAVALVGAGAWPDAPGVAVVGISMLAAFLGAALGKWMAL